jgi:hypothetical protein
MRNRELTLVGLARALSRRRFIARAAAGSFIASTALLNGVSMEAAEAACSGCTAVSGHWCSCTDCTSGGACKQTKSGSCSYDTRIYPSGCWTITSGKSCCDCGGCPHSSSPCTCRPVGYGC